MLFVDGVTLDRNSSIRVDGVHLLTSWPLHPLHPRASKRGAPHAAVPRPYDAVLRDDRFLLDLRFLLCRRFVQRPKQLRHLDLVVQVMVFCTRSDEDSVPRGVAAMRRKNWLVFVMR